MRETDKLQVCEILRSTVVLGEKLGGESEQQGGIETGQESRIMKMINQRKRKWAAHNLIHERLLKTAIEG